MISLYCLKSYVSNVKNTITVGYCFWNTSSKHTPALNGVIQGLKRPIKLIYLALINTADRFESQELIRYDIKPEPGEI
jgi:hypothetical protein